MSTAAPASPATVPSPRRRAARASRPGWVVLDDVPYDLYVRLRDLEANNHHRMLYHNGTLEIMSPGIRHDFVGRKIGVVVFVVCTAFRTPFLASGSTTCHIGEPRKRRGSGAEADEGFYIANEARVRGKIKLDLRVDPPPDLWIEIDDSSRVSGRKRAILAELGIPELWRYSGLRESIRFFRREDAQYVPVERSLGLPMLTPDLVVEALHLSPGEDEMTWFTQLQDWARALPRL